MAAGYACGAVFPPLDTGTGLQSPCYGRADVFAFDLLPFAGRRRRRQRCRPGCRGVAGFEHATPGVLGVRPPLRAARDATGSASRAGPRLRAGPEVARGAELADQRHSGDVEIPRGAWTQHAPGRASLGYITGQVLLFQRFSLGYSRPCAAGEFDLAPTRGGDRMWQPASWSSTVFRALERSSSTRDRCGIGRRDNARGSPLASASTSTPSPPPAASR